jgi:rod shape-determining protein MreD
MSPARGGWVILLSVIVALLLSVVHLPQSTPDWLAWLRPNWLLLVVFYWVMALPHRLGMITAWVIGLFADVLHGEALGVNAFALAGITYLTWSLYERLRMYTRAQQALLLLLLATLFELVLLTSQLLTLGLSFSWPGLFRALVAAFMTALLWPPVFLILRWLRRHLNIY